MENQRTFLLIALMVIGAVLFQKWVEFSGQPTSDQKMSAVDSVGDLAVPVISKEDTNNAVIIEPENRNTAQRDRATEVPTIEATVQKVGLERISQNADGSLITVETDMVIAKINTNGGILERVELKKEPVSLEEPNKGFPLLKRTATDIFIIQDGLATTSDQQAPNHLEKYSSNKLNYQLDGSDKVVVPLTWVSDNGVAFVKTFTFNKDSYVIDVDYQINNGSTIDWVGQHYGSLLRTAPEDSGGGFGRLPSHTGPAYYTEAEKYNKLKFDDMEDEALKLETDAGWIAMLQHYFVAAWVPETGAKSFDTKIKTLDGKNIYEVRYRSKDKSVIHPGAIGHITSRLYVGSKEQVRLKTASEKYEIVGLPLTVDYGFLTFIADPLFSVLSWIHSVVGNWGWAIILLTVMIKGIFYPLSAASYKSMAGMKKLQPRIKTLKERYKDDKPKFQAEMMALYKTEKINPAGGCLPILVQIPVFISLYWALLESVEIRQAPFALWWQDLSAPDPYYVLPVLMGLSMWAQQQLNPAPMDDIQKKVMMVMPVALTFLFLTFPQGLVLYWVVNNVLSMAQQWLINKRHAS